LVLERKRLISQQSKGQHETENVPRCGPGFGLLPDDPKSRKAENIKISGVKKEEGAPTVETFTREEASFSIFKCRCEIPEQVLMKLLKERPVSEPVISKIGTKDRRGLG